MMDPKSEDNKLEKPEQEEKLQDETRSNGKSTIKNRLKKMGIGVIIFFTVKGTITTLLMYFGFKEILERLNGC